MILPLNTTDFSYDKKHSSDRHCGCPVYTYGNRLLGPVVEVSAALGRKWANYAIKILDIPTWESCIYLSVRLIAILGGA